MKLHKGLVAACAEALQKIFVHHKQADRVVEDLLKSNKRWGARDRAFIAENVYECVRWWRLVKYAAEVERADYQEDFWKIVAVWLLVKNRHLHEDTEIQTLPAWEEFDEVQPEQVLIRYETALETRKIAQSVPDWLDETGKNELGEKWADELTALNKPAPLVLRVNTLKSSVEEVREMLGKENSHVIPDVPDAIVFSKRLHLTSNEGFLAGKFEVQDAGSQLVAPFLDIRQGMSVIDACAGAGGKSLHIAALLKNTGSILAMDVVDAKLAELRRRAARNGVKNLETKLIDSDQFISKLAETTDRLLLDVPCSGLGVLRRNPDSKWKLTPAFLDNIRKVQWNILTNYSQMVKKGGKMVYATCSILPSESEEQVRKFVKTYAKDWAFLEEKRVNVSEHGFDGFYMALLERKS